MKDKHGNWAWQHTGGMTVPRGGATINDLYSVREYVERIARHIQQVRNDLLKQFA